MAPASLPAPQTSAQQPIQALVAYPSAEQFAKSAIESVFGDEVDSVGTSKGEIPSKANGYCKDGDSFRGTFEHDGKKFTFELCKDEKDEWHLAYKLDKASRDKLFKPAADTKRKKK